MAQGNIEDASHWPTRTLQVRSPQNWRGVAAKPRSRDAAKRASAPQIRMGQQCAGILGLEVAGEAVLVLDAVHII